MGNGEAVAVHLFPEGAAGIVGGDAQKRDVQLAPAAQLGEGLGRKDMAHHHRIVVRGCKFAPQKAHVGAVDIIDGRAAVRAADQGARLVDQMEHAGRVVHDGYIGAADLFGHKVAGKGQIVHHFAGMAPAAQRLHHGARRGVVAPAGVARKNQNIHCTTPHFPLMPLL